MRSGATQRALKQTPGALGGSLTAQQHATRWTLSSKNIVKSQSQSRIPDIFLHFIYSLGKCHEQLRAGNPGKMGGCVMSTG